MRCIQLPSSCATTIALVSLLPQLCPPLFPWACSRASPCIHPFRQRLLPGLSPGPAALLLLLQPPLSPWTQHSLLGPSSGGRAPSLPTQISSAASPGPVPAPTGQSRAAPAPQPRAGPRPPGGAAVTWRSRNPVGGGGPRAAAGGGRRQRHGRGAERRGREPPGRAQRRRSVPGRERGRGAVRRGARLCRHSRGEGHGCFFARDSGCGGGKGCGEGKGCFSWRQRRRGPALPVTALRAPPGPGEQSRARGAPWELGEQERVGCHCCRCSGISCSPVGRGA